MNDRIHEAVRAHYAEVARTDGACGCAPGCCAPGPKTSLGLGYSEEALEAVPEGADMGLGCGTPLAFAGLREGETVLDLGSGGGLDCFLAAREVGPSGKVIGVDMTPEMVSKARANAEKVGVRNVEFRLGEIEHLPVPDRSVDVIVSNCVINLSPDKGAVLREALRALKPGGRIAIADIVASASVPEAIRDDMAARAACIAGATPVEELRDLLARSGFTDVRIEVDPRSKRFIQDWMPGSGAEQFVASASIQAVRPVATGCCGTPAGSSCC